MTQPPICDYEGSPYQKVFWDQGNRRYEDLAEERAIRVLLPKKGKNLLELGAGAGRNTVRYSGFEHIVLVDYSFSQLEQARVRLGDSPRFTYVAANIYSLPFSSGYFDAATLIRTLHHLADAPVALREIRKTLMPNAFFLLEYANKKNAKAIIRYLLKRQSWSPFSEEPIEFAHLNFNFHPGAILKMLSDSDFIFLQQITVSHFRSAWLKKAIPAPVLAWFDSVVGTSGNVFQFSPSVFVSAKTADAGPFNSPPMFICPSCRSQNLEERTSHQEKELHCYDCGRRWGIRSGIYDFRGPISG
jgi:ubiquinone/menaquinone biosynthesis C-methylase UbiE